MQTEFESQSVTPNILKWKVSPLIVRVLLLGKQNEWCNSCFICYFSTREKQKRKKTGKKEDPTDIKHRPLGLREAFNGKRIKTPEWIVSAGRSWSRPLTRDSATIFKREGERKERRLSTVFSRFTNERSNPTRNRSGIAEETIVIV